MFMANRISNEALLKVAEKVGDNLATHPPPGKGIMSGAGAPFHQGRDSKERQSGEIESSGQKIASGLLGSVFSGAGIP